MLSGIIWNWNIFVCGGKDEKNAYLGKSLKINLKNNAKIIV